MAKFKAESEMLAGPILTAMFIYPKREKRKIQPPPQVRKARTPKVLISVENLPERPKRICTRPLRYSTGETSFNNTPKTIKKKAPVKEKTKAPAKESLPKVPPIKSTVQNKPSTLKKPPPVTPVEKDKIEINVLAIVSKTNQSPQQCAFELSSGEERLDQCRLI